MGEKIEELLFANLLDMSGNGFEFLSGIWGEEGFYGKAVKEIGVHDFRLKVKGKTGKQF